MIRRRLNNIEFSLRLITLFLPVPAFGFAAYLRFLSGIFPVADEGVSYWDYFGFLLLTTLVWVIIVEHYNLARVDFLLPVQAAARRAFWACGVAYVAATGATFFYRSASFSRLFVVFSGIALFTMVLVVQQAFRSLLGRVKRNGKRYSRIAIIGADDYAERAARSLAAALAMPSLVVAFVRLPGQEATTSGSSVIEWNALEELAVRSEIDDVIIAVPPARLPEIARIVAKLEFLCVPIRAILDLGEGFVLGEAAFQTGNITLLDLRASPTESIAYSVLKRTFDLVFSIAAIILTAPLMLLIALAIRMSSQGAILFVQERVGLNGRAFRMYKFRTMRVGNPEEDQTRWTVENDPRRTKIGAFLRRTNLDELPQFFNVLWGDMSIVGPRPEQPCFVRKFLEEVAQYNRRHYLKVGITGWAQVNGWRGDTSIPKRIEYDLYYLKNWSLTFDLKIIFLTLWRGFVDKNAY
jgi:Undecaprenyl-phosphate glucose phosphotransferase